MDNGPIEMLATREARYFPVFHAVIRTAYGIGQEVRANMRDAGRAHAGDPPAREDVRLGGLPRRGTDAEASRATRLGQLSAVVIVHRHHPVRLAGPGDEPRDGDDGAGPCVVLGEEVDRADAADQRDHPSADALADAARRLRPRLRPRPTPVPALRGRAGAATWRRARVSGQPISPSHGARPQ